MRTFAVAKKCCPPGSLPRRMTVASPADSHWHTCRTEVRQILRGPCIQAKQTIGAPNDIYEQEADRVADEVMRMPEPRLQAAPTFKSLTYIAVPPANSDAAEATAANRGSAPSILSIGGHGPRIGIKTDVRPLAILDRAVRRSGGAPLPRELRKKWDGRLGRDLTQIRIHTDTETAGAVEQSGANALNFGPHVFFAPGRYDPRSHSGRRLLGHELAHALETESRGPLPAMMPDQHASRLQSRADIIGADLASGDRPVDAPAADRTPALRGDKKIVFNAQTITVSDEFVLYGPAATAQVLTTFQGALNTYYNNPSFTYRNYQIAFKLTARLAGPNDTDSFNSSTTWINVETTVAGAREGGAPPLYKYNNLQHLAGGCHCP